MIDEAQGFPLAELAVATALDHGHRHRRAFHLGVSRDLHSALAESRRSRKRDPSPPWQMPFFLSFTGVRGVVSLAAALAIPSRSPTAQPFPHRELILFVTFGVIIITLVGQGVMLPAVVRWLGLTRLGTEERQDEIRPSLPRARRR